MSADDEFKPFRWESGDDWEHLEIPDGVGQRVSGTITNLFEGKTASEKWSIVNDFSRFWIIDRIGGDSGHTLG